MSSESARHTYTTTSSLRTDFHSSRRTTRTYPSPTRRNGWQPWVGSRITAKKWMRTSTFQTRPCNYYSICFELPWSFPTPERADKVAHLVQLTMEAHPGSEELELSADSSDTDAEPTRRRGSRPRRSTKQRREDGADRSAGRRTSRARSSARSAKNQGRAAS